jgi:hypothetical protein
MLGGCLPNLKDREIVQHTQMYLVIKKGTNFFQCTSNFWGSFSEFTISLNKNPNNGYEGGVLS